MNNYSSKYGTKKQNFLPNVNTKVTIDSHTTLGKTDRARIEKILNRNLPLYKSYAQERLKELNSARRSKLSIKSSHYGQFNRTGFASMVNKQSESEIEDKGRFSLQEVFENVGLCTDHLEQRRNN